MRPVILVATDAPASARPLTGAGHQTQEQGDEAEGRGFGGAAFGGVRWSLTRGDGGDFGSYLLLPADDQWTVDEVLAQRMRWAEKPQ